MTARWSTALLGGALLLALSNQMLGRACYDAAPGPDSPSRVVGDYVSARHELDLYLSCLDSLAIRPLSAPPAPPAAAGAPPVEPVPVQVYRRACGDPLVTSAFGDYTRRYGTAALSVIRSVAEAELASAAQFLLTPQARAVSADPVWMAAFGRIAARTRGFHADLSSTLSLDPAQADPGGAPAP